jgi:predicted ATP-dependent serine protease
MITEGERNAALTSLAGSMRRRGATQASIEAALLEENAQRCRPPLHQAEVRQIARSIGRYEPQAVETRAAIRRHVQIESIRAVDVTPEPVRWLWTGRIPRGKLTLVEGPPGLGKTLLLLGVAARCSAAMPMPLQGDTAEGCGINVLIVSYEDGLADTLRPRIEAAGADLTRVHFIERVVEHSDRGAVETLLALPEHIAELEQRIRALDARLVVIDPLMAAISAKVDAHKDQDVRRVLAELRNLAERTGAAVVAVRHLRKAIDGRAINAVTVSKSPGGLRGTGDPGGTGACPCRR